jgi:hypothetical protein
MQGMNFVVALLLLAADKDPLRAFWLMVVLLDQVLVPDNYAPNLDGCHVEMRVLGTLIKGKHPKVAAHLEVRVFANQMHPVKRDGMLNASPWNALLMGRRKMRCKALPAS